MRSHRIVRLQALVLGEQPMLETKRRPPRAPEDHRMNLYHRHFFVDALRWYVKISRTGRRDRHQLKSIARMSEAISHQAWEAAVRALGGVPRMRRTRPDEVPATTRRYLISRRLRLGAVALVRAASRQVAEDQNPRGVRQRTSSIARSTPRSSTRSANSATPLTGSGPRSRGGKSANHCRTRRPSQAACVGTGHSTSRATAGSATGDG